MTITLSPQLQAIVDRRIESGCNTDEHDVIREALQLLCERDDAVRLRESLAESEAQIERGERATWSPELIQRLIAEADELFDRGVRAAGMSDRKYDLESADNAQRDIIEIRLYSREVWGDEQADKYLGRLNTGFKSLHSNLYLGTSSEERRPGLRQLVVGEHRIFYRFSGEVVMVLRIVHTKMDLSKIQFL